MSFQAARFMKDILLLHAFDGGNHRTAYMTAYNFLKMNGMEIRVVKRTTAEPFVKSLPEKSYEQIQTWILENMVAIPCSIYCQVDNMKRKGELMKVTEKQRQRTSSRIQPSRIKNMGLQIRLAREQLEHVVFTNPAAIFLEKHTHRTSRDQFEVHDRTIYSNGSKT